MTWRKLVKEEVLARLDPVECAVLDEVVKKYPVPTDFTPGSERTALAIWLRNAVSEKHLEAEEYNWMRHKLDFAAISDPLPPSKKKEEK